MILVDPKYIIAFKLIDGLGNKTLNKIFLREGTEPFLTVDSLIEDTLRLYEHGRLDKNIKLSKDLIYQKIEQAEELINQSAKAEIKIITSWDKDYPKSITTLKNKPLILHYKGDISVLNSKPSITIIGARKATKDSELTARYLAKYFAEKDYNIVSGLAVGCDTAAHEGALDSQIGSTTAILPSSLNCIYPKTNIKLAEQILNNGGLLISEYLIGEKANSGYFLERDKLQAAFSSSLILIQSEQKGGSMHASNYALELNKKVAAVKYKGHKKQYSGNLELFAKNAFELTLDNLREFEEILFDNDQKSPEQLDLFDDH